MRRCLPLIAALLLPGAALAAPSPVRSDDIARFWATYDAVSYTHLRAHET